VIFDRSSLEEPTKSTATLFPFSRFATTLLYVASTKAWSEEPAWLSESTWLRSTSAWFSGAAQVFLEPLALGVPEAVRRERDTDDDADHEREEDRGE